MGGGAVSLGSGSVSLAQSLCFAIFGNKPDVVPTKAIYQLILLIPGYGMTELSPVSHVSTFDNSKPGSVGVLLSNLECKVVLIYYLGFCLGYTRY